MLLLLTVVPVDYLTGEISMVIFISGIRSIETITADITVICQYHIFKTAIDYSIAVWSSVIG